MKEKIKKLHSSSSDLSRTGDDSNAAEARPTLEPPTITYHTSARSIVFRDYLRRASIPKDENLAALDLNEGTLMKEPNSPLGVMKLSVTRHQRPKVEPLPPLELGPREEFKALLYDENDGTVDSGDFNAAEKDVLNRLQTQTAVVKTIKNSEWSMFLQRFKNCERRQAGISRNVNQQDRLDDASGFNSFVTSTSILPPNGCKMRCYGSTSQYTTGVVFALPTFESNMMEDSEVRRTETWAWPAGYAAKTEFNVSSNGKLINGREEALVPLSVMRQYNNEYVKNNEYIVANKKVTGLSQIPYSEVYVRVGGKGRIVNGVETDSGATRSPSYETGLGLPIALFVRTASFGDLISMMRARAFMMNFLGESHIRGIPLLLISPTIGTRALTDDLEGQFWKVAAQSLNPFQNPHISYKTIGPNADERFLQQKFNELMDLDDTIREKLTPEELARIAGGFGATDKSVEELLTNVRQEDLKLNNANVNDGVMDESQRLQAVVNEGLVYAVRSGDYHTSRQLLILYSIVAARQTEAPSCTERNEAEDRRSVSIQRGLIRSPDLHKTGLMELSTGYSAAPPPPPLDTDRLRNATNSDGLLAVLGAAQVLRVMKDGSAKIRAEEVVTSLEEWVEYGQHNVAFRIASWQNQRTAHRDLKINVEQNANFMAFAGNKAITNRKSFASRLRKAIDVTDFSDARFLLVISEIISSMHSPCLRLELLQYVLGLDNRYSVAHVARSVELAATCLRMAAAI